MMQKLNDFWVLLQSDKKTQVIAAIVVLACLALLIFPGGSKRRSAQQSEAKKPVLTDSGAYQDLLERLAPDIEQQRNEITQLKDQLSRTNMKIDENSDRVAEIFKKLMEKMQQPAAQPADNLPPPAVEGAEQISEMESFAPEQQDIAPPQQAGPQPAAFIGAGDSVRVKLLAGVNAPTDGTPYPVVLKLTGDVYGPDGSALPLGEARLIAAAQGSLTDARALFRLTSLNLRLPDGRRVVKRVDGWIVGEDGIRGMSGVLIDPLGKAIGGAMMAGTVEGAGAALEYNNVTSSTNAWGGTTWNLTGSPWQFALGRGMQDGAEEWSDIIKDRIRVMVPVVQVLSGREATAVFAKSVSIKGLYEALTNGDESSE